jgi:hypothetical protein
VSNHSLAGSKRVRCRNSNCRTKLSAPTSNDHKAFCTPDCHERFYFQLCKVCEKHVPRTPRGKQRDCCRSRVCIKAFRDFRESYIMPRKAPHHQNEQNNSRSARKTGVKTAHKGPRVIAGPALSDFSLWAATLDPPKPSRGGVAPAKHPYTEPRECFRVHFAVEAPAIGCGLRLVAVDKVTAKSVYVSDHDGREAEIGLKEWAALNPAQVGQSAVMDGYDSRPQWCLHRQPGDLAAEWTAPELARREAEDVRYVAEDEARLQSEPVDASGNYALQRRQHDR